jgi:hypothetical protein
VALANLDGRCVKCKAFAAKKPYTTSLSVYGHGNFAAMTFSH